GERWEQAVEYGRRAGVRAVLRGAVGEARAHVESALAALGHVADSQGTRELAVDLRLLLGTILTRLGEPDLSLALAREAEAVALALRDPLRLARVTRHVAFVLFSN